MKALKYLFIIFLFTLSTSHLFAQGRGKIVGTITDKTTGEPLIGVNVILMGTTLGATTDLDGEYYIIGVPVSTYDLKASYIGYHSITVERVMVKTDLTTEINIELSEQSIEMPAVTVTAKQKLVQRDITSTRKTISKETMQDVPGLETTADVFKLQGGTVITGAPQSLDLADGTQLQVRDESVKDIHIRGGRGGEILFMVDGIPVNHPLYGGRSVLDLNVVAVEQIELLTGAFSAEYGQAQSGVVNITTRTGGQTVRGGLEYKTDELSFLSANYNTQYGSMYLGGPEPLTSYVLPAIGLDIPGSMSYFVTLNINLTNTPYNNNRDRGNFDLFGLNITERQDNSRNLTAKLNYDITNNFRATASFNGSWKQWSSFNWSWLYYPNSMASYNRDNVNANLLINHVLSKNTFYSINFGFLGVKYKNAFNNNNPSDFWEIKQIPLLDTLGNTIGYEDSIYTTINPPRTDDLTGFYDSTGVESIWRDDDTKTYTLKADFTSMFHKEHLLKIGFDVQYNQISYIDIQDGGYKLSNYGEFIYNNGVEATPPPGPFKAFGQNRWVFDVNPLMGGVYVQEKFEKEFMVINAGLRGDWFYLGKTIDEANYKEQWERATGEAADWSLWKLEISPRFGISFPILEQTVIFFSYGHFAQLPELQFFYRDPYTGGFTGNPKLDYENTILYEFGFTHQLFDDVAIDIKSYAKDISQQVGTTQLLAASGLPVSLYDNVGYARARGLEFEINKGYSSHTTGKLTYTVQWANGYSSSAFDDYIRSTNDFPKPIRERRLGWDVRHQIILQASFLSNAGDPISLFGFELPDDWNFTILSSFSSGQPYTPGSLDPAVLQKTENTSDGPITTTTDLKFQKGFDLWGTHFSLMVDVFNLFDQNNTSIYYGFNVWTGEPYRYGDLIAPSNQVYDYYSMFRLRDPRQFSTGRYIRLGFKWDF